MADRIICMRDGRIEQAGTPDDLYLRPESLFIAGFIGSPPVNLISGEAEDGAVRAGRVAFPFKGAWECHYRAEARAFKVCRDGDPRPHRPDGAYGARDPLCCRDRSRTCAGPRAWRLGSARSGRPRKDRLLSKRLAGVRHGDRKPDDWRAGAPAPLLAIISTSPARFSNCGHRSPPRQYYSQPAEQA